MKVAQNTVHRPQTAAGAQDTWTHGKCCPQDTEPQPFPLTPGIRRVSRLSMTKKKKNYCISVHPNQQLFQVRISLKSSLHLLFVLCFLRTPFFHCRCWTAWLGSASSWFCRWQWREAQEVNGAFISFLEKVLLILWRGSKGDKTIGKNIEALWSQ